MGAADKLFQGIYFLFECVQFFLLGVKKRSLVLYFFVLRVDEMLLFLGGFYQGYHKGLIAQAIMVRLRAGPDEAAEIVSCLVGCLFYFLGDKAGPSDKGCFLVGD